MPIPRVSRFKTLFDFSAWLLMLPAVALLMYVDPAMTETILQWLLVALVLAGLTIIVSRLVFPQVNIGWLVVQVEQGNTAAGLLASALVLFVGMIFIGIVLWARA